MQARRTDSLLLLVKSTMQLVYSENIIFSFVENSQRMPVISPSMVFPLGLQVVPRIWILVVDHTGKYTEYLLAVRSGIVVRLKKKEKASYECGI